PWFINHLLGDSRELANFYVMLSISSAVLRKFKSYRRLYARSTEVALKIGDPNMYGHCIGMGAVAAGFMGAGPDADARSTQAIEEYGNILPVETLANTGGTQIWSYLVRGY